MVQWCYESTSKCKELDDILVATDDQRIVDAVTAFGGKAVMTSPNHATGTDRIAEAIQRDTADLILNVQGDEPLMSANVLSRLILTMRESGAEMGTAAVPFKETGRDPMDPNAVKVVVDKRGFALYFSRSIIPFIRGKAHEEWFDEYPFLKHLGIYAYRREVLAEVTKLPQSSLEKAESLEQLRWLQSGYRIRVGLTDVETVGIDTPEDLQRAEAFLKG